MGGIGFVRCIAIKRLTHELLSKKEIQAAVFIR